MNGQMHAMLGLAVLIVNLVVGVWAVLVGQRGGTAGGALRGGVIAGLLLLVAQLLTGLDLLGRGLRPANAGLTVLHVGGPVVALVIGAVLLLRPRARVSHYATAALFTAIVALISYGIGEMGA